jgi:DNA-binding NarL/FixJ family response regulator
VADGPLRGSRLDSLATGVAAALNGIHAAGIVHRDLKASKGGSRFVFRAGQASAGQPTEGAAPAPPLTARERDVLVELCRPLLAGQVFTEPAGSREIAAALVVTEAAVKQHLQRLYQKFGVDGDGVHRRARLANEAMSGTAVTVADLRAAD